MSTVSRLVSGSAASWAKIGVTTISQLALVPLYLSYWSAKTYGISLAVLALTSVICTLDFGHHTYLQYEFLRIGSDDKLQLRKYLWSGVCIGILICATQMAAISILLYTNAFSYIVDRDNTLSSTMLHDAGMLLFLQGLAWTLSTSIPGLFQRVLAPFGYYPRMSWWNFLYALTSTTAPILAVVSGAGLVETGIASFITSILYSLFFYYDLLNLLKKEEIDFTKPSWQLGYKNFVRSVAVSAKGLLENVRIQGVRLILVPILGANGLAAFSTMRTGANVALQGLNTITNPIMPELMRFLRQRDQARVEVAFATVWIVVVVILAPALVVMQAIAEPLFAAWTRGQIQFNPLLFATLSLSILVYAAAQPAIAIVVGNNLLKPQLILSLIAAVTVVGGILLLVPVIGMLGGGIALLLAEIAATVGYRIVAERWLNNNGLRWPKSVSMLASISVGIAAISMGLLILFPNTKLEIAGASLLFLCWNAWRNWQALPEIATQKIIKLLSRVPGVRRIVPT